MKAILGLLGILLAAVPAAPAAAAAGIHDCARLAADPGDPDRPDGVDGIAEDRIDEEAGLVACEAANNPFAMICATRRLPNSNCSGAGTESFR